MAEPFVSPPKPCMAHGYNLTIIINSKYDYMLACRNEVSS